MEEIGIEQARQTLGEIVDRARFRDEATLITRQNKPAAVIAAIEPSDEEIRARIKAYADAAGMTMAEMSDRMRRLSEALASGAKSMQELAEQHDQEA
jgi:prevent-host-death family protein